MIFRTDKNLKLNLELILDHLKGYKDEDVILIDIKKKGKTRSYLQNNYYWAILNIISKDTGNSSSALHSYFGDMYLKVFRLNKLTKKESQFILSTKKLNTKQFSQYIEKVRNFSMSELNIYVPSPDEYRLMDNLEGVFDFINN